VKANAENEFSLHDISNFPLVRIRLQNLPTGYARIWTAEMSALLQQTQPFVLVFLDAREEESLEDRKTRILWLKANKAALAARCRGFVAVEPSSIKRLAKRTQGAVLGKTFGLRFLVVRNVEEAEGLARRLLADEAPLDADAYGVKISQTDRF
jgi:hypothetical protein